MSHESGKLCLKFRVVVVPLCACMGTHECESFFIFCPSIVQSNANISGRTMLVVTCQSVHDLPQT